MVRPLGLVSSREDRTDEAGERFSNMKLPAEAAKNSVQIGRRHILDQKLRIERQRKLIEQLERDGDPSVLAEARRFLAEEARRDLSEMEQVLSQMEADFAAVQQRIV
jgi:hypothetical protein